MIQAKLFLQDLSPSEQTLHPASIDEPGPIGDSGEIYTKAQLESAEQAAFEAGLQKGREMSAAAAVQELSRARDQASRDAAEKYEQWAERAGINLQTMLHDELNALEERITASVSRVLRAFLKEQCVTLALTDLKMLLGAQIGDDANIVAELKVPHELRENALEVFSTVLPNVEITTAESFEITLSVDQTVFETQLGVWIDKIENAVM